MLNRTQLNAYPLFRLVFLLVCLVLGSKVHALGTTAGTDISNTAEVSFDINGSTVTENSNTVVVTVAEILDVDVTVQSPQTPVAPNDLNQELLFTVTNTGNGLETFTLSIDSLLAGDDFDPTPAVPAIYFDTDSSGDLSAGDTPYTPGTNDPQLAADASVSVLLVNDIPGSVLDGQIGFSQLTASSATGSGSPGDVFAGQGDGGIDAVVGASGAADNDTGEYIVSSVGLTVVKSAAVTDQFGGTQPIPGAQITYQIVATVTGAGQATNAVFTDQIPVNTTYQVGSLTLNGATLTDAPDADAGQFVSAGTPAVTINLGNLTNADGPQTITFVVVID
ncbi:MAG: hypothetical protein AAF438_14135 [Pseudomonadota bacterium]